MNYFPEYIPELYNRAVSYAASFIRKVPEVEVSDERMVSLVKGALGAYGTVLAGESVRISLKNEDVNKVLTDYSVISSLYQQSLGSLQKDLVLMGKSQFDHTLEIHLTGEELKLMNEFDGKVPTDFEGLESLPGVGHKTASVVMAQAFSKPAFPVDTHIHRLAKRWGLSNGKNVMQTEKDLKKLFAKSKWNKLHLQIIYFARKFCKAVGHKKEICPLCNKIG